MVLDQVQQLTPWNLNICAMQKRGVFDVEFCVHACYKPSFFKGGFLAVCGFCGWCRSYSFGTPGWQSPHGFHGGLEFQWVRVPFGKWWWFYWHLKTKVKYTCNDMLSYEFAKWGCRDVSKSTLVSCFLLESSSSMIQNPTDFGLKEILNTRWFKVAFLSPNWRSFNRLKRSLKHPKRSLWITRYKPTARSVPLVPPMPPSMAATRRTPSRSSGGSREETRTISS